MTESSSSSSKPSSSTSSTSDSTSSSSFSSWKNHINELVHQEPYSTICYGVFWLLILVVATPFCAIITLFPLTLYRFISYKKDWNQRNKYNPMDHAANNSTKQFAILVTGCDSGFGKDIALQASDTGYIVFAGCLNEESLEYYNKNNVKTTTTGVIKPLLMDVTKDEDVQDALLQVQEWIKEGKPEQQRRRLFHALINNAGISIPGKLDWNGKEAVNVAQKVMDVNYFGVIRTCQTFLSLFKDQRLYQDYLGGRIINITSVAGLTPGGPGMWNYGASKHATQNFSEGLQKELSVWDISVTTINPGFHSTPIMENTLKGVMDVWNNNCTSEIREQYGEEHLNSIMKMIDGFMSWGFPPKQVTSQIMDVLQISKPPGQVLVGMDARYLFILTKLIPGWLSDMEPSNTTVPAILLQKKNKMKNKTDTTSETTTTNTEKMKSQ